MTTTVASALPAFIDKLATVARAAFPVSGPVKVYVGPTPPQNESGQALWIGASGLVFAPGQAMEAATAGQDWAGAEYTLRTETLTVHCIANAWHGSNDFTIIRDLCYAQLQVFAAAVLLDPTLGQTVRNVSSVGASQSLSWLVRPDTGTATRLAFDVTAQTFLDH